jgi:hypothetical protein
MMGSKQRHFAPLINVSLEDLVPVDHFYRHLERTLDLSFVREFVQETYAPGGRPSIDPVVFLFLEGLASVVAAQGEFAWAVRLWGAAESLRKTGKAFWPISPAERATYTRLVATAGTRLGEEAFTTVWTEGRTMTPEQALTWQRRAL